MSQELSHEQFKNMWDGMTEEGRELVRAKARWEHITLWAVLNDYLSLRPFQPDHDHDQGMNQGEGVDA